MMHDDDDDDSTLPDYSKCKIYLSNSYS